MPYAAITYQIKGGHEDEIAAVFEDFQRPRSTTVRGTLGNELGRILGTAVFIRDDLLVRVIEYEGDLEAVIRYMAGQPGVREVERRLKPYLSAPRDTSTEDGFLRTFQSNMLRCVMQRSVPREGAHVGA